MENITTTTLMDVINNQVTTRRTRVSNWVEIGSKKKLTESKLIEKDKLDVILQLRGTFNFNLHVSNKWMVITMYNNRDKYSYLVLNLTDLSCVTMGSIREAKKYAEAQLAKENNATEDKVENVQAEQNTSLAEESVQAVEEQQSKSNRRKSSKKKVTNKEEE